MVHPEVHAVRVLSLGVDHPRVRPAGRTLDGLDRLHRHGRVSARQLQVHVRPRRPDHAVGVRVRRDLSCGRPGPVLAHVRRLRLQQLHRGVELLLVQLVRVLDSEIGLRRLQPERGVGDEDRVVVDRDLALVRRELILFPDHPPAVRVLRNSVGAEHEVVGAAPVGHAVGLPVERVVVLVLDPFLDVGEVRNQLRVDRSDVPRRHHPDAGVAGCRNAVVLARLHETDHVVRRAAVLRVHGATGRRRELVDELRVARPLDDVDLALLACQLLDLLQRGPEALDLGARAAAGFVVASTTACRHHAQRRHEQSEDCPASDTSIASRHSDPPSGSSMTDSCSGRHSNRTRRPFASKTWLDPSSRFCASTCSSPPRSSVTW